MIFQLVRRDQDWRMVPWMTLCLCAMALAGSVFTHHRVTTELLFSSMLPMMSLAGLSGAFANGASRRASLFQAALPISARDLFVAKLLSQIAGVWCLLLSAAAACYVAGPGWSVPFPSLIMAEALVAVTILALLSVRLRDLSVPNGIAIGLLAGLGLLDAALVFPGPLFSFARPGIVLPVCAGTFAALLWRDLASMPKVFQVAPMDAVAERPARRRTGSVRPVWWPVWRSAFYGRNVVSLIGSAIFLASGMWQLAPIMLASFVTGAWYSVRWLWPLPVARRKVLAMTLLIPLLLEATAQLIWPSGFVRAVALAAMMLLSTSASLALLNPTGMRAGARLLVLPWLVLFLFAPLAVLLADAFNGTGPPFGIHARSYTIDFLTLHLAGVLPSNPSILIAGTLVALGALYWLVQRQFESADFVQFVQTRFDTAD
jgi:hypothetical protein